MKNTAEKIKILVSLFSIVCLAGFAAVAAVCGGEKVDVRVRTWIDPVRIVHADEGVAGAEKLLAPKHGQVSEGYFGSSVGTVITNAGSGFILDFGRELHGGVQLGMSPCTRKGSKVRLRFGESVSETLSTAGGEGGATNDHAIRDFEILVPWFGQLEIGNTGYRFLRIDLAEGEKVGFEFVRAVSLMRPMKATGSFKSSDERLNRVFDTAVRTVHLCCQDYLWDGIKRDRLVWMGDTHPETMTILNVFGAASILPESLDYMAAVTPPEKWMNTMPTYTLWWIRNLAEWYRYTGDRAYLAKYGEYLEKTFDHVLTVVKNGEWIGEGKTATFLDWPTHDNPEAEKAGSQGLALITARETAMMAEALGNESLASKANALAAALSNYQLPTTNHQLTTTNYQLSTTTSTLPKSAAALLALSGLGDAKAMFANSLGLNGNAGVSTFYGYYMLEAMSAAGENRRALDTVRDYWGGMLDVGATSFWEDFDLAWTNNCFRIDEMPVAGKKDIHGDYGNYCYKGFRHSFCHGWAAGPAAWCINHVLGIRPLDVGCTTVEVKPFLGDLDWAQGAMALPNGERIEVKVRKNPDGSLATEISAPDRVKIVSQ